jgi:RNA polymerase sigma factor (sigma-70 family)
MDTISLGRTRETPRISCKKLFSQYISNGGLGINDDQSGLGSLPSFVISFSTRSGGEATDFLSRTELDVLLAKLNGRQRDIVKSISIDGSSIRETARKLDMSEGTVRVALHRALKKLAVLYRSQTS